MNLCSLLQHCRTKIPGCLHPGIFIKISGLRSCYFYFTSFGAVIKKIQKTLEEQSRKIIHRNMRFLNPVTIEAAESIFNFFPDDFDRMTFLTSGSEAVEFALNFTKKATKTEIVLSLKDSLY